MSQFFEQLKARDKYKNLIVETIQDGKNNFTNLEYSKFKNSVIMLECLMDSYKEDPNFLEKINLIQSEFNLKSGNNLTESIQGIKSSSKEDVIDYFRNWFKALVNLATRTVFSSRMTSVDINLGEVMNIWREMAGFEDKKNMESDLIAKSFIDFEEEIGSDSG